MSLLIFFAEPSSCTDLIFTSHQNLVMESGVHASLYLSCHHQIIYAKFNLKINYPPPYEREIWHHEEAVVDHIRKVVDLYSWEKAFRNPKSDVNFSFRKMVKNIISNYIPHETITFEDSNPPLITHYAFGNDPLPPVAYVLNG